MDGLIVLFHRSRSWLDVVSWILCYFANNLFFLCNCCECCVGLIRKSFFLFVKRGKIISFKYFFLISFTLYSAHSRVSRGDLVLRHSVSHFPPKSRGIVLRAQRRACNGNIDLNKYFIFPRMGIEPTTSHVYSHTLSPAPRLASDNKFFNFPVACGILQKAVKK